MSEKNFQGSEGDLFQTLQRAEQALWHDSLQTSQDDDEISRRMAQEEFFYERRRELRAQVAARFDVPLEHLRAVELKGIQQSWPWEEA